MDPWICGFVELCGSVDLWVCESVGLWICRNRWWKDGDVTTFLVVVEWIMEAEIVIVTGFFF